VAPRAVRLHRSVRHHGHRTDRSAPASGATAVAQPPIPIQAGLDRAAWTTLIVPPDDPDTIFDRLVGWLDDRRRTDPQAEVTFDYTGGTKSMSVGAALAAVARPDTRLQVTSGQRSDLVRVLDGTQRAIGLSKDRIAIERQIELLRGAWSRYGYQEAAEGFEALVELAKTGGLSARIPP